MRQPSAIPWPSSAVNSGPRRLSPPPRITETYRNSQPTCSTAFWSSPADRPDMQSQAQGPVTHPVQLNAVTQNTPARTGGELLCPKPLQTDIRVGQHEKRADELADQRACQHGADDQFEKHVTLGHARPH